MSKINVAVDVSVEIDPPNVWVWRRKGETEIEARARAWESWAREFMDFVRDHRSQDPVHITVNKVFKDVCSHCENEWEEDSDGPLCCNAAQAEWIAAREQEQSA